MRSKLSAFLITLLLIPTLVFGGPPKINLFGFGNIVVAQGGGGEGGGGATAVPTFGAAGSLAQAETGDLTVVPPTIANNDILIIVGFAEANDTAFTCSGFTSIDEYNNTGGAFHTSVLWKRASSEAGNYTVSHSGTVWKAAIMFTIKGCPTTGSPFSGTLTHKTITNASITNNAMTPADDNTLIVHVSARDADTTVSNWAGGSLTWTERADVITTGNVYMGYAMATAPQTTAAAVSPTATASAGAFANAITFAMKPAPATPSYATIDLSLASTSKSYSTTTNTTLNKPTGTVDGDFLLAGLYIESGTTVTPPSGWTEMVGQDLGDGRSTYTRIYYKTASSEGASWDWVHASASTEAFCKRITGVKDTGSPEDCTRSVVAGEWASSLNATSITTVTNGAAVCQVTVNYSGGTWTTALTSRVSNPQMNLAADIQSTAGATGTKSAANTATEYMSTILFALRPKQL